MTETAVQATTYPVLVAPTVDDVGAVLRARTKDLDGVELGTFNVNTRPTGTEAQRLINIAYNEVTGVAGLYLAPRCAGLARSMIVVRAAWWIEGSYWPEQVRSDRSIYRELADQFTSGMQALVDCAAGNLPDGGDPAGVAQRFGMINVHGWTATPYFQDPPTPT